MTHIKRLAAASMFAALAFMAGSAQEKTAARKIAEGVYYWQGDHLKRAPANCTWVVFRDYVLVIDGNFPWGAREILPEIRKTTSKPIRYLFNTHHHSDHTFGTSVFTDAGATVICSEECASEMEQRGRMQWDRWSETGEFSLKDYRYEMPSIRFAEKMVFDDGTMRVELTRVGPAHSLGDAVAYLPREKILIAGDLCVNWDRGNNLQDPNGDHEGWIRALDQIGGWDIRTVVPGHGSLATPATLRAQREYIADMIAQVRQGIKDGRTEDEMVRRVDVSRHGSFGKTVNESGIRAIYRKLPR